MRGTRGDQLPGYDPGHRTSPIRPQVAGRLRTNLREARIDVATTAKGWANLEQQRAAHEQLGEDATPAEL